MHFKLEFTSQADFDLKELEKNQHLARRLKSVRRALGLMETNLKHPSLNTHKYSAIRGQNGEDIFESYAENNTPTAYRIFWMYGPGKKVITIVAITPHP